MSQTRPFLKSTPQSDPGCSEVRTKLPVARPAKKTDRFPRERGVWGTPSTKTSLGTGLSVTFALASLLHCFMYLNGPFSHPSPASLSLCWFPVCSLNPSSSFLWLALMWALMHSLRKYLPASSRPELGTVQLPKTKSHNPLPLISSQFRH